MTASEVFDQALDRLETCRQRFIHSAMDGRLNADERMAMGHKAHRLREIIRRMRKDAAEFYDA